MRKRITRTEKIEQKRIKKKIITYRRPTYWSWFKRKKYHGLSHPDVILTENYMIPYDGVNNMNTIIISSVGTGKTRGFLKSNLLQKGCSFVITDTKGELYEEFASYLQDGIGKQYQIKLLDLANPERSNHYNPFHYMYKDEDVTDFAMALAANVSKGSNDPFWMHASKNLIAALCFYLRETMPLEEQIMSNVSTLLSLINIDEEDRNAQSELDILMENLRVKNPESMAVRYYDMFRCGAGRTISSILITAQQAISVFEFPSLKTLMGEDDLCLESIGDKRTALFINLDDTNNSYDFVAGLVYTQLFQTLYRQASLSENNTLKEHVRFFMDDFANYKIPSISHYISTCRSRGISLQMILQSEPQLRTHYGYEANNLIANSTYIYIGCNDLETQSNVARRIGIDVKHVQNSFNKTYVFSPEGPTIVDIKADYTKHPLYDTLQCCNHSEINLGRIEPVSGQTETKIEVDSKYLDEFKPMSETIEELQQNNGLYKKYKSKWEANMPLFDDISVKKDCFDSDEERMFYEALMNNETFQKSGIVCETHRDLRDIFDLSKMRSNKLKFKKLMLMHVDFLFTYEGHKLAALEIDGNQHYTELTQIENDLIKNELFSKQNLELIREKASSIRQDCDNVVIKIVDRLTLQLQQSDTTDNNT